METRFLVDADALRIHLALARCSIRALGRDIGRSHSAILGWLSGRPVGLKLLTAIAQTLTSRLGTTVDPAALVASEVPDQRWRP